MLLTTLFTGVAGLVAIFIRLHREFPTSTASAAVVLLAGATPLTWYSIFEPAIQEVAIFTLAAWLAIAGTTIAPTNRRQRVVRAAAWAGLVVALLSSALWMRLSSGSVEAAHVTVSDVLFSSRQGFLSWSPVAYVAVVGTLLYARRDLLGASVTLGLLVAVAWLLAGSVAWQRTPGFAGRSMVGLLAVLAPGLACFIDVLRRRPLIALAPLVVLPLVWNHLLMVQYTIGLLPKDEPISFARMVRQQAELHAETMPMYPFAFPANVWFAWREGVPVQRYDTLALEPRAASVDLALDRNAERFLLEGWSNPAAEGEGQGWWIGERRASVVVPLSISAAPTARLTIVARSRFEEPTFEADLRLLLNGHEIGDFSPPATRAVETQFTVSRSALRNGLNTITIVSRGFHPVDPSDTREPGPVARRAARSVWPVAVYRIAISPL